MFGKNPIRKIERSEDNTLAVQEVFHTIQGEGPFSGLPAVFVRLAGCHLACTFCDTEFESNIKNRLWDVALFKQVHSMLKEFPNTHLVVLTGGEPLRQQIGNFVSMLFEIPGCQVQLETAGNLWDASLDKVLDDLSNAARFTVVCSPKTSQVHQEVQKWCAHYKYVVRAGDAGDDGLPMMGTQQQNEDKVQPLFRPVLALAVLYEVTIWVSPCDEYQPVKNRDNMKHAGEVCMKHGYRLSLQAHKYAHLP